MKEEILRLRAEGKTYNAIVKLTGASKSTIAFHCGPGQKAKFAARLQKARMARRETVKLEHGGKCKICGYDRCLRSLQFHHKNPTEKSFEISRGAICHGIEAIRVEALKCLLVCANCHGEIHAGMLDITPYV